jgi:hypothetical protein
MDAIETVKQALTGRLERLIQYLGEVGDPMALGFFGQIYDMLLEVQREEELLEVFLAMSTAAFQGFTLDPFAATLADDALGYAEQVAHTFSVPSEKAH